MKQVLFRRGRPVVQDVPAPTADAGEIAVRLAWSCVSPGTELTVAGSTSLTGVLRRVREDRSIVRKAVGVFRDRGFRALESMARSRLGTGMAPGYSASGIVIDVGEGVDSFRIGDRVACAGSGYASHAEVVVVPRNLVAHVPPGLALDAASTVTLGAIALQGVRRARVAIGEKIGVIGLGMLGQLTVRLLKAAGCEVFGVDLDSGRVEQARAGGLDGAPGPGGGDAVEAALRFSDHHGLDAVIITAATRSDEPLAQAMRMARRKGRVVVVGDVGLDARREEMYPKELDLLISTSYGPGRYDASYEEGGLDYPYAFVRWTENRNMQAYLALLASGRLCIDELVSSRFPVAEAEAAYAALTGDAARPYTVLLEYPDPSPSASVARRLPAAERREARPGAIRLAIIGAGSFARAMHVPILRAARDQFSIDGLVTRHGYTAEAIARSVGARWASTDYREALADPDIDALLVATRHDLHAPLVREALAAGKHVFVEKPLAITAAELEGLDELRQKLAGSPSGCPAVMVGFNRRYSPFAERLRELLRRRSAPFQLYYRMNAGYLPPDHWVHGPEGGGRLIGEACHILDLFRFLAGAPAVDVSVTGIVSRRRDVSPTDNFTSTVRYADGSVATLVYTAQGSGRLAKEYLEVAVDRHSAVLHDYRRLQTFGWGRDVKTRGQDKGHRGEWQAFADLVAGRRDIDAAWDEALEVSRLAIGADRLLRDEHA